MEEIVAYRAPSNPLKFTTAHRLPLLGISADVKVDGTISQSAITQTFYNPSTKLLEEANYMFSLCDGAVVSSFRCTIGERRILNGMVEPRYDARIRFQDGVHQKHSALLLEEDSENFHMTLGHIPPKERIKVEITYTSQLEREVDGGTILTIPKLIAPGSRTPAYQLASFEATEIGLSVKVLIRKKCSIGEVESQNHPISINASTLDCSLTMSDKASLPERIKIVSSEACITFQSRESVLEKDIVLIMKDSFESYALLEKSSGKAEEQALVANFSLQKLFPSMRPDLLVKEVLFVIDTLGASNHHTMDLLQRFMKTFLDRLTAECFTNVYTVGGGKVRLWKRSQKFLNRNLDSSTHISHLCNTNVSGRDILPVLEHAVGHRRSRDTTHIVTVLANTRDGSFTDMVDFVKKKFKKHKRALRFSAVGIGDSVSSRLVEEIGQHGGGIGTMLLDNTNTNWEKTTSTIIEKVIFPESLKCEIAITGLSQFGKSDAQKIPRSSFHRPSYTQAPYLLDSLEYSAWHSVYFMILGNIKPPRTVNIAITTARGVKEVNLPVHCWTPGKDIIHHLAAKSIMVDLETGDSWVHKAFQSLPWTEEMDTNVRQEAERLGERWSISGKWTSYVAVDNDNQRVNPTYIDNTGGSKESGYSPQGDTETIGTYETYNPRVQQIAERSSGSNARTLKHGEATNQLKDIMKPDRALKLLRLKLNDRAQSKGIVYRLKNPTRRAGDKYLSRDLPYPTNGSDTRQLQGVVLTEDLGEGNRSIFEANGVQSAISSRSQNRTFLRMKVAGTIETGDTKIEISRTASKELRLEHGDFVLVRGKRCYETILVICIVDGLGDATARLNPVACRNLRVKSGNAVTIYKCPYTQPVSLPQVFQNV